MDTAFEAVVGVYAALALVAPVVGVAAVAAAAHDARRRGKQARPLSAWLCGALLLIAGGYTAGFAAFVGAMTLTTALFVGVAIAGFAVVIVDRPGHTMGLALAGHTIAGVAGWSVAAQMEHWAPSFYLAPLVMIAGAGLMLASRATHPAKPHP